MLVGVAVLSVVALLASLTPSSAAAAPAAPTGLEASPSQNAVTLSWSPPPGEVSSYRVERSADNGSTWTVVVANTGNLDTARIVGGLSEGRRYHFRVRALAGGTIGTASAAERAIPCRYRAAGREYTGWLAPCWLPPSGHPFQDVTMSWQREPVAFLVANDVTYGTSATRFSPSAPVTRGQVAAFLWRLAGRPTGYADHGFVDVTQTWQQEPLRWLKAERITLGTSATRYSPDAPVTRGQMAALLWRLVDSPTGHAQHRFTDVKHDWQEHAVRWLADTGVTRGVTDRLYDPEATVTRGQMAAFLHRLATNTFTSITYFGTGDALFAGSVPADNTAVVALTHRGSGRFAVEPQDREDEYNDLMVEVTGGYEGTRPLNFNSILYPDPVARFAVEADGFWTIVVRPLNDARTVTIGGRRSGTGDDFLVLPVSFAGRTTYQHDGPGRFEVFGLTAAMWEGVHLQADAVGDYSGSRNVPAGTVAFDVRTGGSWSIQHAP